MATVYVVDESYKREQRRIVKKLDGIKGPGVTNTPEAIVINPPGATPQRRTAISDGDDILVKITGAASGGGKYNGRTVTGTTTAVATGTLTMPEGMTVASADDCLVLNGDENGKPTHQLKIDGTCFIVGHKIGATSAGLMIVLMDSVLGATASPATLGAGSEGSEAASTDTWTREAVTAGTDYGGVPLELWTVARVGYFDAGNETLYAYLRKLTFDACGRLRLASAETRVTVDVPEVCA